jgi:pimeloyl-ACP methyl ester carboxylesterase
LGEFDNASTRLRSGISLSYHEEGESSNLLVLLHGLNAHSGTWRKNITRLSSENRKAVAPSLPPWPRSRPPEISGYIDTVYELIEELRPSALSIAGNSMGGWIAMKIAARLRKDLVKAIVLEDSAGTRDPLDRESINSVDSLGMPVLIIWGENDPIIPSTDAELLHSMIKNSKLHVMRNTGHVPHWEKASEFNLLVGDFLSKIGV